MNLTLSVTLPDASCRLAGRGPRSTCRFRTGAGTHPKAARCWPRACAAERASRRAYRRFPIVVDRNSISRDSIGRISVSRVDSQLRNRVASSPSPHERLSVAAARSVRAVLEVAGDARGRVRIRDRTRNVRPVRPMRGRISETPRRSNRQNVAPRGRRRIRSHGPTARRAAGRGAGRFVP